MNEPAHWPELEYGRLAPTVDYLNRVVQAGGKYTLGLLFEPGWGDIVFDVTPRGLRTPLLRHDERTFSVHYRLLDGEVAISSDVGEVSLGLDQDSVACFYRRFCAAMGELGIAGPDNSLLCEIPGGPQRFESDETPRTWDPVAAALVWRGFASAAEGLQIWQAPYRCHRPRTGVMWGGFDLSATRYHGVRVTPPSTRPYFLAQGMTEEYVSVGFWYGNARSPEVGFYAYIAPQPPGIEGREWSVEGAFWSAEQGLVLLPWSALRQNPDPVAAITDFGDAVYQAAVELSGWEAGLVGPRVSGWHASRTPPELVSVVGLLPGGNAKQEMEGL